MMDALTAFLAAAVRTATPLLFAATGELVAERAGLIFVGLEGAILVGALAAAGGAVAGGLAIGIALAVVAGALTGLLFAHFAVRWRAEQIVTGTAITLLATGATGALYQVIFGAGGAALRVPTLGIAPIPGLSRIPVLGPSLFAQSAFTYVSIVAIVAAWWWLTRTHAGLALRACGERPAAARAAGIDPERMRTFAATFAGALGGVAGAVLVLALSGTFAEGMSAGRGFIAIAIVALGRWRAPGVMLAALAFGAASALQFLFQAMDWDLPYQLFLALPYLATLGALATTRARGAAPAALGRPIDS